MTSLSSGAVPGAADILGLNNARLRAVRNGNGVELGEFLDGFDWSSVDGNIAGATAQRAELVERFPRSTWSTLSLDAYALNGPEDFRQAYSYGIEFASDALGSIKGGSSYKHGIYRGNDDEWHWKAEGVDPLEVWSEIRRGLDRMLTDIETGEWDRVDEWNRGIVWPAVRLKTASLYFPDEIVPIYSQHALKHFLGLFGIRDLAQITGNAFCMNRTLLAVIRSVSALDDRDPVAVMGAFYAWDDPRGDGAGRKRGKPSAASNNENVAITGEETLAELVDIWRAEDPYPNEQDKLHLQRLSDFRNELAPDRIAVAPLDDLKRVWWPGVNYGATGPMSVLNRYLRDATEPEVDAFRATVKYLMYGDEPVEQRLDAVLDGEYRVHGLGESVAVKYLSIALPDRIIPLFPFDGDKGKRAAFKALPLGVEPASFNHLSRGERQIHSNDVLLEKVAPLLSEDMWEIQRFLWWATRQYEALEAAAEGDEDAVTTLAASAGPAPDTRSARGSVTLADVAARTLMDPEWLTEIANALRSDQPHVILAGPPGTSKTFLADHMASHLTGGVDRAITTVQLHPSYGYEEFVEGLRPTTGDNGELRFVPEPGPLLRVAEAARRDADSLQVLIVDEMNRANLPRVFGELLFLLEYRDRSLDLRFHPGFSLPENVALIGTMNTADRSIRSIDAAIRRRFEIFECMPDPALLERWFASERGVSHVPDLREGFERLNGRLTELLDRHHTVGHSFLMRQELTSDMLRRIWARRIGPLVEEYLFDRPDTAREITLEWCWPSQAAARR